MTKAVFLDRDGVLNKEIGAYVYKSDDFEFNFEIIEKLKILKSEGFIFIVISNQGGIAKGLYTKSDVEILNKIIQTELAKEDLKITEFYYCPHHPYFGNCLCRKPNTSLLERAIARFDIDVSKSFFVGDMQRDVDCAENIGLRCVKIEANKIEQIVWKI
jgi:D-glycero-D-manno-heptose 1,7-bisphosphate phosphatase